MNIIFNFKIKRIVVSMRSFFKHNCIDHKEVTSRGYFIDGDSGVVFATDVNYKCGNCGKRWVE
jgi:hypothetical protein